MRSCYKYTVPNPDDFVELDMDEDFYVVQSGANNFSRHLALSTAIIPPLGTVVRAHRNRYKSDFEMPEPEKQAIATITRRCPSSGPFPKPTTCRHDHP